MICLYVRFPAIFTPTQAGAYIYCYVGGEYLHTGWRKVLNHHQIPNYIYLVSHIVNVSLVCKGKLLISL